MLEKLYRPVAAALLSLGLAGAALASSGLPLAALAQGGKTLRILVGFPPGGGSDAIARLLADKLKDVLGVPVVVENRPGAGGQIAAQVLKTSVPDGNTLFFTHDHTISILPQVVKHPGFDPAQDFIGVGGVATFVNAFAVSGGTPARSFGDYVAWVKAQGGKTCRSQIGAGGGGESLEHQPNFLMPSTRARFLGSLSKSEASCSVIAPANCSTSVMVTAR